VGYCAQLIEGRFFPGPDVLSFSVFLSGAAAATFADAVPLSIRKRVIDDNLSIPVLSGSAMFVASLL